MGPEKLEAINRASHIRQLIMAICTLTLFVASMCIGHYKLDMREALQELMAYLCGKREGLTTGASILLNIRLPRSLSALLVGGVLSLSGFTYQSVFRNRLASPDLLGVSTGCYVGAAFCIMLGMTALAVQIGAFFFGLFTVNLTYMISKLFRSERSNSLLLSGVLVGGIMSSLLGLIKYMANPETQLPSIVYWTMGDISSVSMEQLKYVFPSMALCAAILCVSSWRLNFFALDESISISMGVNIRHLKFICVVAATLLTAGAVSVAGTISWIGLAMPQVIRLLCGENTKHSVLTSIFAGAIFLLTADIFGRCISSAEIPMSVLTGVPGVVIFIFCIYLSNRKDRHGI